MSMLKPCPKCGSRRYIVWENDYWFSCRDCGWSTGVHKTMDDAIKAWNDSEPFCDSCSNWQNDGDTDEGFCTACARKTNRDHVCELYSDHGERVKTVRFHRLNVVPKFHAENSEQGEGNG